jgi:hypothetical protein
MRAYFVRTAISLIGIVGALALFMIDGPAWLRVVAGVVLLVGTGVVATRAFRRLADPETRRRDLEDRVRNTLG